MNLVAGASHIRFRDFALGTVLGEVPGLLGMSIFVDQVSETVRHPSVMSVGMLAGVVFLFFLAGIGLWRWLNRRANRLALPGAGNLIMRLSLATYNIHSCIGGDGRYDPGRILGVLKELDVDIIALQEVDSREHQGLELMHWLAQETGLHAIAGPTLLRQTGKYGNALLLRCEALRVRLIDLTVLRNEPRGAIDVDVNCDGHILQLIATHLGFVRQSGASRCNKFSRVSERNIAC